MNGVLADVSVVILLAPGETAWRTLSGDLAPLSADAEVLLVATQPSPPDLERMASECDVRARLVWLESPPGRRAAGSGTGDSLRLR